MASKARAIDPELDRFHRAMRASQKALKSKNPSKNIRRVNRAWRNTFEDGGVVDYMKMNDGGMASNTRVY